VNNLPRVAADQTYDTMLCKFVLITDNGIVMVSSSYYVGVNSGEPKFESPADRLRSTNVTDGDQLRFPCRVSAEPVAEIVWLRNGIPLDGKSHFL